MTILYFLLAICCAYGIALFSRLAEKCEDGSLAAKMYVTTIVILAFAAAGFALSGVFSIALSPAS